MRAVTTAENVVMRTPHEKKPTSDSRVLRRLVAAEGYLELEMAEQALSELGGIEDPGPYEAEFHYLRGEAFRAQKRFAEAIEPLARAASLLPPMYKPFALRALGQCFRELGDVARAEMTESQIDNPAIVLQARVTVRLDTSQDPPRLQIRVRFNPPEQSE